MASALMAHAAELTAKETAIVTIAALAARPETAPQMKAHIAIGKLNGITDAQAEAILRRAPHPERRHGEHSRERQALARCRAGFVVPAHRA